MIPVYDGISDVSIHASAGEATGPAQPEPVAIERFYPRLRGGGDIASTSRASGTWEFLSTPPRGRRPAGLAPDTGSRCFYPRLRGGGDDSLRPPPPSCSSFYPRLRGGGDSVWAAVTPISNSFYPRLRGGGDVTCRSISRPCHRFYPRLRGGGDGGALLKNFDLAMFLSTPPRGRRRAWAARRWTRNYRFYPRLRGGGDNASNAATVTNLVFLSTPPRGRRPRETRRQS